jgi:hypothetical protein
MELKKESIRENIQKIESSKNIKKEEKGVGKNGTGGEGHSNSVSQNQKQVL